MSKITKLEIVLPKSFYNHNVLLYKLKSIFITCEFTQLILIRYYQYKYHFILSPESNTNLSLVSSNNRQWNNNLNNDIIDS